MIYFGGVNLNNNLKLGIQTLLLKEWGQAIDKFHLHPNSKSQQPKSIPEIHQLITKCGQNPLFNTR